MRPNELFSIEYLQPLPAPHGDRSPRLPALAAPIAEEALPAWMIRFAQPLHVSPEALLFEPADASALDDPTWWRNPKPAILEKLAARTGASLSVLQSMTFADWKPVCGEFPICRIDPAGIQVLLRLL